MVASLGRLKVRQRLFHPLGVLSRSRVLTPERTSGSRGPAATKDLARRWVGDPRQHGVRPAALGRERAERAAPGMAGSDKGIMEGALSGVRFVCHGRLANADEQIPRVAQRNDE